jgi:hypothetical protein
LIQQLIHANGTMRNFISQQSINTACFSVKYKIN